MNGPYEVSGDIGLNINDDMSLSNDDPYYLCRCGASENKPFCDGSHKKINFSDE
ncbi:MAG: CDGSH iron-sulfur domain-containing protein [Deltaproteobacteria bacterium]|nr:CDGSH iron-sulfur domain-containing protein [Deltaproteobacteria bacterium]